MLSVSVEWTINLTRVRGFRERILPEAKHSNEEEIPEGEKEGIESGRAEFQPGRGVVHKARELHLARSENEKEGAGNNPADHHKKNSQNEGATPETDGARLLTRSAPTSSKSAKTLDWLLAGNRNEVGENEAESKINSDKSDAGRGESDDHQLKISRPNLFQGRVLFDKFKIVQRLDQDWEKRQKSRAGGDEEKEGAGVNEGEDNLPEGTRLTRGTDERRARGKIDEESRGHFPKNTEDLRERIKADGQRFALPFQGRDGDT